MQQQPPGAELGLPGVSTEAVWGLRVSLGVLTGPLCGGGASQATPLGQVHPLGF